MYGWDPGLGDAVLLLGGLLIVALILFLDYWVIRNVPSARDQ